MTPARGQIWTRVSDASVWRVTQLDGDTIGLSGPGPARSMQYELVEDMADPLQWTFTWAPAVRNVALQGG